jgi:hypothetical protein
MFRVNVFSEYGLICSKRFLTENAADVYCQMQKLCGYDVVIEEIDDNGKVIYQ